jgi:hypothetical protein
MPKDAPHPEVAYSTEMLMFRIVAMEQRILEMEQQLPHTNLLSPKFLTRAFTVLGHAFVAYLIIAAPFLLGALVLDVKRLTQP